MGLVTVKDGLADSPWTDKLLVEFCDAVLQWKR